MGADRTAAIVAGPAPSGGERGDHGESATGLIQVLGFSNSRLLRAALVGDGDRDTIRVEEDFELEGASAACRPPLSATSRPER